MGLTNTTPSFLHFNGPSHEDDTWVNCYHAISQQFRVLNRGHSFYDIDHNILISTDDLCDYNFFRIRNFMRTPSTRGWSTSSRDCIGCRWIQDLPLGAVPSPVLTWSDLARKKSCRRITRCSGKPCIDKI